MKEAVWIRKFVGELAVVPSISNPVTIYCDNTGPIVQCKEPRYHKRSKHIQRKYHLTRDYVEKKKVVIAKIPTEDNIVDPLTKGLSQAKHDKHMRSMALKHVYDWL